MISINYIAEANLQKYDYVSSINKSEKMDWQGLEGKGEGEKGGFQ